MTDPEYGAAACVILAAGKGKRMKSALPKVLHPIAGLPMLGHVLKTAAALSPRHLVVVTGHGGAPVSAAAARLSPGAETVVQDPPMGTGHAVMQSREVLDGFAGDVFVLYGDTPLIRPETLRRMAEARRAGAGVVVLGFMANDPGGYGRLKTGDDGALEAIVEAHEADEQERAIRLCNSGVMCIEGERLFGLLDRLTNDNIKAEYYLTDIVALARADGFACAVVSCPEEEVLGVNSRVELAQAEAAFQARARHDALVAGVTMTAPETVFLSHDTVLEQDVSIAPHVVFGPGVRVASGAVISAFSHLEGCTVGPDALIGPYARLRPGAEIGPRARIGNFVEVKNVRFGEDAKANHLTYLGDASIGAGSNIGAGTITCNYDGVLKHRTEIGAGVFVGSNSALVAPVTIGDDALIGAGATITDDVPAEALAVARASQMNKHGLAPKLREKLRAAKAALSRS